MTLWLGAGPRAAEWLWETNESSCVKTCIDVYRMREGLRQEEGAPGASQRRLSAFGSLGEDGELMGSGVCGCEAFATHGL